MFRASSAHHQEFSTALSALASFMQVSKYRFQADGIRTELSSILILVGSGHQNLHETYQCRKYSTKLLMMGREDIRNM